MYKILLITFIVAWCNCVSAQTYYVSTTGSATNDGLSQNTAWNLEKLNQTQLADNAIVLFRKGDVFRGEIASYKSPKGIKFGSYGEGAMPMLKGSVTVSNWVINTAGLKSQVYQADVSGLTMPNGIVHLYIDGKIATIARYPNATSPQQYGDAIWLETDGNNGAKTFFDEELKNYGKPNDYWNGATLRLRNYSWTYTVGVISDYVAQTGTITADCIGSNQYQGWGYFIDGKLQELDYPNEWFYDATTKKLYVYCPKGDSPNNHTIEAVIYSTGISITNYEDNAQVDGLQFMHYADKGVNINSSSNVTIQNCKISYCQQGIYFWNCANTKILNNTIEWCFQNSLSMSSQDTYTDGTCQVIGNQMYNSAMMPAYTSRTDGTQTPAALNVAIKNSLISKNIIRNTCYSGITLKGKGGHIIEKNIIDSTLLLINDGGCIQLSDAGNNTIRNNFLSNAIGNTDKSNGWGSSSGMHHPSYGMGIGADPTDPDNITVENNTIFMNHDVGVRYNGADNSVIRNNVFYDNYDDHIYLTTNSDAAQNVTIEDNIFYSLRPHSIGLSVAFTKTGSSLKSCNRNFYGNPYNRNAVQYQDVNNDKFTYSLEHWKAKKGFDSESKQSHVRFAEYITQNTGSEVLLNNNFDLNMNNFAGSCTKEWTTHPKLDDGCVKATFIAGKYFSYEPYLELTEGQYYRLRFSVIADKPMTFDVRFSDTGNAWEILEEITLPATTERENYEYVFRAKKTASQVKLILNGRITDTQVTVYFDNFYFMPVTATLADVQNQSKLFTNPSDQPKTVPLGSGQWTDIYGNAVVGSVTIPAWSSKILINTSVVSTQSDTHFAPASEFSIFPNPANFYVQVESSTHKIDKLEIFDIQGKRIINEVETNMINVQNLKEGLYLLKIHSGCKTIVSKIILQH